MKVFINEKESKVDNYCNIDKLLQSLTIVSYNGIAIAVNNEVISRNLWKDTFLKEDDNILIIEATKGG